MATFLLNDGLLIQNGKWLPSRSMIMVWGLRAVVIVIPLLCIPFRGIVGAQLPVLQMILEGAALLSPLVQLWICSGGQGFDVATLPLGWTILSWQLLFLVGAVFLCRQQRRGLGLLTMASR